MSLILLTFCFIKFYFIFFHTISYNIIHLSCPSLLQSPSYTYIVFLYFVAFAKRVVAVELNKTLCIAANENLSVNNIKNVLIIPCDSEVFAKKILKNRSYTREDTGEAYDFKIVLVDPPR